MSKQALRIYPPAATTAPPNRGQLLDAAEVAARVFAGRVKARWVMEHVPCKVRLGHRTVFFYEADVREWLEQHREAVA